MEKSRLRGMMMFTLACFTSPCCTPLIVPLAITLLAGTPAALWMTHHLGWVYGVLTVISAISFVLALRWLGKRNQPQPTSTTIRLSDIPVIPSLSGGQSHVEQSN